MTTRSSTTSPSDILQAALDLAEEKGWDNIRLYQVAERLQITLEDIHAHFPDLNAVANAWFHQARLHMVSTPDGDLDTQPARHRLSVTMSRWLDFVARHPKVTTQIIRAKLHPPHVHHWVPMIFDLSNLIHWWLDAAHISAVGRKRQFAEVGLTAIFLSTLAMWSSDRTSGQHKTHKFLNKNLKRIDRTLRLSLSRDQFIHHTER